MSMNAVEEAILEYVSEQRAVLRKFENKIVNAMRGEGHKDFTIPPREVTTKHPEIPSIMPERPRQVMQLGDNPEDIQDIETAPQTAGEADLEDIDDDLMNICGGEDDDESNDDDDDDDDASGYHAAVGQSDDDDDDDSPVATAVESTTHRKTNFGPDELDNRIFKIIKSANQKEGIYQSDLVQKIPDVKDYVVKDKLRQMEKAGDIDTISDRPKIYVLPRD